jgi:TolB-like protein/Tfp pilus assembly protein PilF
MALGRVGLVGRPALGAARRLSMPSLQERLAAALGDRYRIESELGRGGMAVVYRAHDVKHDRPVAVKVLRPELGSSEVGAERFLQEIRVVARLTHPHILPLHDSGLRDGLLYYVMPLVGESLRDRLTRERRLPVDDAVRIASAVAEALGHAHAQNVLHRDVKPENILFNAGYPMVTDFGVARAIAECCDVVTQAGIAVGTPAYMSPEQASAEATLDGRSDLYSLACVLYEMLTGEPPFASGDARTVMARHVLDAPPPVRSLRPDVPAGVAAALARALAKDCSDRFATAEAFAAALRARASGAEWLAAPRRRIAVLPLVNASGDPADEYLSDGITDALIDALAHVEGLEVASRTSVFALKGSGKDVRAIGAHLHVFTVLEGTVRRAGSRLRITVQLTDAGEGRLLWSQRYDREAADVFVLEEEIAQATVQTLRRTLLRDLGDVHPPRYTRNVAAYNLYLQGRYFWNRRTAADVQRAIELFERAIAADPEFALAYTGLADSYALQLDYRSIPVVEGLQRAKAEARRALAIDEGLAEAHTSLAWVLFIYDWDWPAAEREFRRAIEIDPRYATAHQWYAWLLVALGRLNEALASGHLAAELDPASVSIRRGLGWLYHVARQSDVGVAHLERAIAMDPTAEESHRSLALVCLGEPDLVRAEAETREALRLVEHNPPSLGLLAHIAARAGRREEALALVAELTAMRSRGYVTPVALATAHLGLGDVDAVFTELERAYQERRGWLTYLNVEPLFDSLRDDPRFLDLRRRLRLA